MPEKIHGDKFWNWVHRTKRFRGYCMFGLRKLVLNILLHTQIYRLHKELFWTQNLDAQIELFQKYLIPFLEAEAKPENRQDVETLKKALMFLRTIQIAGNGYSPTALSVMFQMLVHCKKLMIITEA